MTKLFGKHTVKFGVQHQRWYDNALTSATGLFYFDAAGVTQQAAIDFGFGSDAAKAYGTGRVPSRHQ